MAAILRRLPAAFVVQARRAATASVAVAHRDIKSEVTSELFDDVQKRLNQQGRTIEKVLITYQAKDGSRKEYLMNKNLSTPYDCTKHINMLLAKSSVLAVVRYPEQEERLQSMNEPFRDQCVFEVVDFQTQQYAQEVNQAYWRSCCVLLAAALSKGLKDNISIQKLHYQGCMDSMHEQWIISESYFAVDVSGLNSELSEEHRRELGLYLRSQFIDKAVPFETVSLPLDVAAEYGFDTSMCLCRVRDFVTAVDGPVISRADQVGRYNISKALNKGNFTRIGGVSLPFALKCSSYSWQVIVDNATDDVACVEAPLSPSDKSTNEVSKLVRSRLRNYHFASNRLYSPFDLKCNLCRQICRSRGEPITPRGMRRHKRRDRFAAYALHQSAKSVPVAVGLAANRCLFDSRSVYAPRGTGLAEVETCRQSILRGRKMSFNHARTPQNSNFSNSQFSSRMPFGSHCKASGVIAHNSHKMGSSVDVMCFFYKPQQ